jgi:hypothetical protein
LRIAGAVIVICGYPALLLLAFRASKTSRDAGRFARCVLPLRKTGRSSTPNV